MYIMQLGSFPAGKSLSWQKVDTFEGHPPTPRRSCSISYHYDSKQAFLFGGKNDEGNEFDDRVYSLSVPQTGEGPVKATWKVLGDCKGHSPGFISGHSAVFVGDKLYIFGGKDKDGRYLNALHQMDIRTNRWSRVETTGQQPPPRTEHAMTCIGTRIYVFGGEGQHGLLDDLYLFDFKNKTWQKMPTGRLTPHGRQGAALLGMRNTNDDGDLLCLMFGGDKDVIMDDMFTYSSKTKEWYERPSKGQLSHGRRHFYSCLLMAGKILLFGGTGTSILPDQGFGQNNDCFVYNVLGGSWTKLDPVEKPLSPTPRSHMAGFKYGLDIFFVYGGLDNTGKALDDLWCVTLGK